MLLNARIAAANSISDRGYDKSKADLEELVDLPAIVIQMAEQLVLNESHVYWIGA